MGQVGRQKEEPKKQPCLDLLHSLPLWQPFLLSQRRRWSITLTAPWFPMIQWLLSLACHWPTASHTPTKGASFHMPTPIHTPMLTSLPNVRLRLCQDHCPIHLRPKRHAVHLHLSIHQCSPYCQT